jgi:hypothetical protein
MQPLPSLVEPIGKQHTTIVSLDCKSELPWWVEINTSVPLCTYYFGPFDNRKEAQDSRTGYVNDLHQEEARGIVALIKQCQPDDLTIDQGYYIAEIQNILENTDFS